MRFGRLIVVSIGFVGLTLSASAAEPDTGPLRSKIPGADLLREQIWGVQYRITELRARGFTNQHPNVTTLSELRDQLVRIERGLGPYSGAESDSLSSLDDRMSDPSLGPPLSETTRRLLRTLDQKSTTRVAELPARPTAGIDSRSAVPVPDSVDVSTPASDELQPVVDAEVEPGFLGVKIFEPTSTYVDYVYPNSTAARIGVKVGDQVVSVNKQPVTSLRELKMQLMQFHAGDRISISMRRDGKLLRSGKAILGTNSPSN